MNLDKEKIVVLDTNVLLYDPLALRMFDKYQVVLPLLALEEVDSFKTEKGTVGRNARLAVKILEQVSLLGRLHEGVQLTGENCKFLGALAPEFYVNVQVMSPEVERQLSGSNVDNKILALTQHLSKERSEAVQLVTRDINLRIKARALGLDAAEYDKCPIENEEYKGWHEEFLHTDELKALRVEELGIKFDASRMRSNEFLWVKSIDNTHKFRIFRFLRDDKFIEVSEYPELWGFGPRNALQEMALNLLLDDAVPLVFLLGPAGTGKTLMTMLAGLYKVTVERNYSKFFIARPLVSLGADIGFMPGDLQDKLFHWMHPFYDNLEYIFDQADAGGYGFRVPKVKSDWQDDDFSNSRKGKKAKFFAQEFERPKTFTSRVHEKVDVLQQRGFLSLEAITHMRGRSLPEQFIFIDEAQNLTSQEVKTIITRAGEGTKIVLAGDPYQIDSASLDFYNNGLVTSSLKLRGERLVGQIFVESSERSPLAKLAVEKL